MTTYKDNQNFLIKDSGYNDQNRYVIFFFSENKIIFEKNHEYVVDGTFKTTPYPFNQLLIIHATILGKTFPYVYVLMKSRTEQIYKNILEDLKNLINFEPIFVISDFEKALHNAFVSKFPLSTKKLCFFSFF